MLVWCVARNNDTLAPHKVHHRPDRCTARARPSILPRCSSRFKTLAEADPAELRHKRPTVPHRGMTLEEVLSVSGTCGTANQIHIGLADDVGSMFVSFASASTTGSVSFSKDEADITKGTGAVL